MGVTDNAYLLYRADSPMADSPMQKGNQQVLKVGMYVGFEFT